MGPETNTKEYIEQVKEISLLLGNYDTEHDQERAAALWYVPDNNYSRAAICEALNRIKTNRPIV